MLIFQMILLGIVQGLTEFLPVSSSGHLVMLEQFLQIKETMLVTIFLHLGTLFAVCFIYRKKLLYLILHPFSSLGKKIIFSTLATCVVVLIFKSIITKMFTSYFYIVGFALTGFILIVTEVVYKQKRKGEIQMKNGILIGLAQGIASLPGISRSGTTIAIGMLLGENKKDVADFSFLLSIPIIIASCVYELCFNFGSISVSFLPLFAGLISAFIFGIIAIKVMLKVIQKMKLYIFGIYLLVLSILLMANVIVF